MTIHVKAIFLVVVLALNGMNATYAEEAFKPQSFCNSILVDGELSAHLLARIKADYQLPDPWTKKLEPVTPVHDQGEYGSCWIHATTKYYEYELERHTGKHVGLSSQFLLYMHLVNEAIKRINDKAPTIELIRQGDLLEHADVLMANFGIVPEEVWKPRIAIEKNGRMNQRLLANLNTLILKHRREILNLKVREAGEVAIASQRQQGIADVVNFVTSISGPLPEHFEFNGFSFTPTTFAEQVVGFKAAELRLTKVRYETPDSKDEAFNYIKKEVDLGRPVSLAIQAVPPFIDPKTNLMSVTAFISPFSTLEDQILAAKIHLASGGSGGGHAVVVTGYSVDSFGRPVKLLIENSWGTRNGSNGFYTMDWSYFMAFPVEVLKRGD